MFDHKYTIIALDAQASSIHFKDICIAANE